MKKPVGEQELAVLRYVAEHGPATVGEVAVSLGWRAVLRNLQHADAACEAVGSRRAWTRGLVGCLVVAPLGLAAAWDAAPVLSFLR